jgi:Spy/CpxP family protein refolding chaperone
MKWHYLLILSTAIIIIIFVNKVFSFRTSQSTQVIDKISSEVTLLDTKSNSKPVKNRRSNLVQQLNLTTEQQQKIEEIRRRYQKQIVLRKKEIGSLQKQLTQMMAGNDSANEIRAKNQELMTLHQQIGDLRFESMLATREILTIEQRQKFVSLVRAKSK